jgi:radical SAM-linked protein
MEIRKRGIVYRIRFSRKGKLRFLSHLDQINLIRRILRRAGLPVAYSEGFHPQMKISFGPAVSVGYESEAEFVDMELNRELDYKEIVKSVASASPEGFTPVEIKKIPPFLPSLESSLNLAQYSIRIPDEIIAERGRDAIGEGIGKFLAAGEVNVEKIKQGRREIINARALVREMKYDGINRVEMKLEFGPKKNVKPEKIIAVMLGLSDEQTKLLLVTRKELMTVGLFPKTV